MMFFCVNLDIAHALRFIIECSVDFVQILQEFTSADVKRLVGYNGHFFEILHLLNLFVDSSQ